MKRWAVLFGILVLGIILAADFGLIGFLNLLIVRAIQQTHPGWRQIRAAAGCSLLLIAVAGLEEWSQRYIGGRTFSGWDFAASAAGIAGFGLAAALWSQSGARSPKQRVTDRRA